MDPLIPLRYLAGSPRAAEALARWRFTPLLGLVLVATAGLARNWDNPDGLLAWDWFWGPLLASTFTASVVLGFSVGPALKYMRAFPGRPGSALLSFLGLVWMTAPCAWLYAIPVERWAATPLAAAKINVALLCIVAVWRVWILSRACAAVARQPLLKSLLAVLCPAAFEFAAAAFLLGMARSVAMHMGGVRAEPPPESLFMAAVYRVSTGGGLLLGSACLVGLLVLLVREARSASRDGAPAPLDTP